MPAPVSADGGGGRRAGDPVGRRRARNRRYHRNRSQRSLQHLVCWNAYGFQPELGELERWLLCNQTDVVADQEGQFSWSSTTRILGFQPPVVTRRARGRITGASSVKGGDVALYVRAGVHFVLLTDRPLAAADDSTENCGVSRGYSMPDPWTSGVCTARLFERRRRTNEWTTSTQTFSRLMTTPS